MQALRTYAIALGALLAAVVLRQLLDPVLGDSLPFVTLFGAVAAAAWVGGAAPAAFVTMLGYLVVAYLFITPRGAIAFRTTDVVGMAAYVFTCALIILIGQAMRRARARADERGEILQVTLQSIGDAVITTDVDGDVTSMNRVAAELTGWTPASAVGQPLEAVFNIISETTRAPVESPSRRALREGTVVGLANHTLLIRRDGSECAIDDSAAPIRDNLGHVSGCVLIFRDVSEQRKLEREKAAQLRDARMLASIVQSSEDAIISKNLQGIIESWNDAAERIFGFTAAEALGKHISIIIPPDRISEEDHIIRKIKAGERISHVETIRQRKDGSRIHVSLTISPLHDRDGQVIGASKMVRDVTEKHRADVERERLAAVIETSTDFIGLCDADGVPFFINRAGRELVGLRSIEEVTRIHLRDFFFPEDHAKILHEFFPQVERVGNGSVDVRFRHFVTGEPIWMEYKVVVLRDDHGKVDAFATVSQNVTARRQLEAHLRALADDVAEQSRNKDEFLAMLSHELRNPLAPISNAVRVLTMNGNDASVVREASAVLDRQVGQMSHLVDDLLDMSRITRGKIELRKERVDVRGVIEHAMEATRALHCEHTITASLPGDPIYLDADPTRLAQVVGNLLNNACKFTDPAGRIHVSAAAEGDTAVLSVEDAGIGMAPEDLSRIFDMFTQIDGTLERSRGGLGIGLTLVRKLVEMHGGSVEARSAGIGRGSAFVIRLPVSSTSARSREIPAAPRAAQTAQRRVLVVDDNQDGAESLAMVLRALGHEAVTAYEGPGALAAAATFRPDVVLLDIGLPGMNGFDVCRQMRKEAWGANIAIIAVTGWGQDKDRVKSEEAGFDTHLVKPVGVEDIRGILATMSPS